MRRFVPLVLVVLSALTTACGGKIAPSTDDTGGTTEPGPPSSVTPSPTQLPPPSSDPLPPPSLPPKPSAGTYTAHAWAGGLDHLEIFKADFAANTCVHLRLASPQPPGSSGAFLGLKTPATWSVTGGDRTNDATTCKATAARPDAVPAIDGKGLITWDSGTSVLPCSLSIHAALIFDKSKVSEQLDADGIPVDGCM